MKKLTTITILAMLVSSASAATIATTGYEYDWIFESGEEFAARDASPNGFVFYSADSGLATTTYPGFATSGAETIDGKDFQLQSYSVANILYRNQNSKFGLDPQNSTLTLDSPGSYTEISVLGSSMAGNATDGTMTINFSDATNSGAIDINFVSWIDTSAGVTQKGLTNNGTSVAYSGAVSVVTYDLAGNGFSGKTIESITFNSITNNGFAVFAVSGVPEPGSLAILGLGGLLIGARRRRKA